jgi:pantothenate kinase
MAQPPVFLVYNDQDVYVRPRTAVTSGLGPKQHHLEDTVWVTLLQKVDKLGDSSLLVGLQALLHSQPSSSRKRSTLMGAFHLDADCLSARMLRLGHGYAALAGHRGPMRKANCGADSHYSGDQSLG